MPKVYIDPKSRSQVFYRTPQPGMVGYVPEAELEAVKRELEDLKAARAEGLQIYRKPYEPGNPVPEEKGRAG